MDRLENVFRKGLDLVSAAPVTELTYQNGKWDSIAHLRIVAAIETEFGIMFETDHILGMSSFHKAVETVRELGVEI